MTEERMSLEQVITHLSDHYWACHCIPEAIKYLEEMRKGRAE